MNGRGAWAGLELRRAARPAAQPATLPPARTPLTLPSSLHMQATKGDVVGERPMWAERGGLDFDGRARWDAWAGLRGKKDGRAKLEFVRASGGRGMGWVLCGEQAARGAPRAAPALGTPRRPPGPATSAPHPQAYNEFTPRALYNDGR